MSKIHSSSAFIFLDANYYFLGSSYDEMYICWSLGQTLLVQEFVKKWNSIGNLNPDNISISCLLSSFHGKIVFFFIIAYLGTASKKKKLAVKMFKHLDLDPERARERVY